jgi:DNA polymerase-3 subunit alpha
MTDTGIFQFEGWTAAKGCREVGVKTVKDLILVNALYRPATLGKNYHMTYLRNRSRPDRVDYKHPIIEKVLRETHGIAIYQEQVLAILRNIGVSVEDLNKLLKAIKHAKAAGTSQESQAVFANAKKSFYSKAKFKRLPVEAIDEVWEMVEGFATYGFNRSHATGYAVRGYRCAYLKTHFPLEFHAALLETTAGTDKEAWYVQEARRMGIRLLAADVNVSDALWTIDRKRNAIRRGLTSVKGIGVACATAIVEAREKGGQFKDIDDLIARTDARAVTGGKQWAKDGTMNGSLLKLKEAGALKSLGIRADS